jgi:hypothetical protein
MITALLIIIIVLLGYENWQFYKMFTEKRLNHEKIDFKKVMDLYEKIQNDKKKQTQAM